MARSTYDILNARRKALKMTYDELSEKSNVSVSSLKKICTGVVEKPALETVRAIAYALGLNLNDLDGESNPDAINEAERILLNKYHALDEHGRYIVDFVIDAEVDRCKEERKRREQEKKPRLTLMPRYISMPVYNEPAAAGNPMGVDSDFEYVDFEDGVVPEGTDFGVRIKGDSMGNTVPDGCIAFVRKAERAEDGDIVIAWVDGEGTVCKRFVGDGDRLLYLKSDNEAYPNITGDALIGLRIHGVVVGNTAQA